MSCSCAIKISITEKSSISFENNYMPILRLCIVFVLDWIDSFEHGSITTVSKIISCRNKWSLCVFTLKISNIHRNKRWYINQVANGVQMKYVHRTELLVYWNWPSIEFSIILNGKWHVRKYSLCEDERSKHKFNVIEIWSFRSRCYQIIDVR